MAALYRVTFEVASNEDLRQAFALAADNGQPVDLTGGDLRMSLHGGETQATLALSLANGRITIVNATAGQFALAVAAADLAALPEGVYRHDLVLTLAGTRRRIWSGTLALARGITP
jgi:hypothetical protein